MALEELSWVGVLGKRINIAEDALRLIIGMVLGEILFYRRILQYVSRNYYLDTLIVYPIIEFIQYYFSLSRVFTTQQITP